jgi:glycosyltransferase involved in cell wall biosynthesis
MSLEIFLNLKNIKVITKTMSEQTLPSIEVKRPVDLAIIIPTLNEQNYIGKLLDSIIEQSVLPLEIVVVDAYSLDKTILEIKKRQRSLPQLKFYQIPKYSISRQRNFGARKTKASNLLFLDADTELKEKQTLQQYIDEVNQKKPDIAAVHNYPLSDYWKDKMYFMGMKILFDAAQHFYPVALTINLYVSRQTFDKNKGFNESVRIGEDIELVQRVVRNGGKFMFLKKPKIYTSVRRYQKEGRIKLTMKFIRNMYYIQFHGYKYIPKDYEFGKFN